MDEPRRLIIPEGDPVREYTPEENRLLTDHLAALLADVQADVFHDRPVDRSLICDLRARIYVLLVRLGLRPIALEVPRQEYLDALNHFFTTREMRPLVDLYIRCYSL